MTVPHAAALGTGRFELRGTLGAGGAGTVYRVYDRQLEREVALKLLRQASGRDLYRFKREFRALADIQHPNLIQLHELHAAEGDWYFTMELVEGVSFIDWVRPATGGKPRRTRREIELSPLDEPRLRAALVQLVDGLLALHEAGKLHRDLKPSNVLVTAAGRVALLDFGLVASVAEDNPERLAVGTPAYMSPEQASDQPLAEPSDWYSLGAMLYEALTGWRPFEGEAAQVMTRKQSEIPVDPRRRIASTPVDLAQLCMELLSPAAAARPTGETILARLGAAPSAPTRDLALAAAPPPFVGRRRELDELGRALADTRTHGVAVMVRGKSGIGKSTLVRRFLREVGGELGDQVFVLEGRCYEREQVPFKMLDGIVDALTGVLLGLPAKILDAFTPRDLGALMRLFPVMRRVKPYADAAQHAQHAAPSDPVELRRRGFAALRQLLSRLARYRTLVIFIDDAHWGDADSAVFLREIVHRAEPGMLIVVAHRPEDYLGVIAKLKVPAARRGDVRDLEVVPLADAEAHELVDQLLTPGRDAVRVAAVVRAGAGNPLVLTELARSPDLAPGAQIHDLVRARVARLPPDAQALLAVSSIAARPLPVEIAARAAGVAFGRDEAEQLAAERLATLRDVDGQMILQPAHDHVRQAVLAGLDPESRVGWHEALARAFEDVQAEPEYDTRGSLSRGFDAEAVVEHWLAAGHPANAAHHAMQAAQRAEAALAFGRAAELYDIALNYGPWDTAGRRDLMRKKAEALTAAGQLDEAATIYGHAAQLLEDDDAIDLQRLYIEALLRRGRAGEAIPAAAQLLAQIGVRSPLAKGGLRTRLTAPWFSSKLRSLDFTPRPAHECSRADLLRVDVLYSITSGLALVDQALGAALQPELLRAALDCREPVRVCLALAQEVSYAAGAGSRNAAVVDAVGARLSTLAQQIGEPHVVGLAHTAIGIAAVKSGRWLKARQALDTGLALLRDHGGGLRWEIDIGEAFWLMALVHLGEWRELVRQTQILLREALERGDVVAQLAIRIGIRNIAWLVMDRPAEARAQLEAAVATFQGRVPLPLGLALVANGNIALYTGDAAAASRELEGKWPDLEQSGILRQQHLRVELVHLRARAAIADVARPLDERVRRATACAEELLEEGAPWAAGLGYLARAGAYALHGEGEAALVALLAAEAQLAAANMDGWLQLARMRRGMLQGGQGAFARAAAARDALADAGVSAPERMLALLVPWPT